MHMGHAARQVDRQVPHQPAQIVVLEPRSGHRRRRSRNRRLEDLFHTQSRETDQQKRKELVWDIDTALQQEGARPVIFHTRGATCWHFQVKGLTPMVNGWRMEDVWLDRQ